MVTSPPYGPSTHGQVAVAPGAGVQKYHHLYGNTLDRGNLANIGHHRLLSGFTRILAGLVPFLRPGGHIAITIRPWREHAELIDLPSQILACGLHAGLIPVERCVALLARAAEHDLVARGSFFQRDFIRKQREAGLPLHLIAMRTCWCSAPRCARRRVQESRRNVRNPEAVSASELDTPTARGMPRVCRRVGRHEHPAAPHRAWIGTALRPRSRRRFPDDGGGGAGGHRADSLVGSAHKRLSVPASPGPVIGSVCTGYGGLDLGVLAAFGGGRIAWCADPDPHIAAILARRLPGVPNHGDVRAIDWASVEPVEHR